MKLKKLMLGTTLFAIAVGTALPLLAADTTKDTKENRGQLSARDYKFVLEAARGGMHEIRLGELAKTKGISQQVRDFGQRMFTDHSKAAEELKQIAATKGAVIPTEMSHKDRAEMDKFEKLSGREFDKEYAEHMVKDHKTDVKEFKNAANDLSDPDLKAFAQKTLTVINEHLRMPEELENSTK